MISAIDNLKTAFEIAMKNRPQVGGFPYLAEVLRQAGVAKNIWSLPSCQSIYLTNLGPVVVQQQPLLMGPHDIPLFDQEMLIQILRKDQRGESTFPEFLEGAWTSGVVSYEVDLEDRTVAYYGCNNEKYMEDYPYIALAAQGR